MNDNIDLSKVLQELNSDLNYGLTKEEVDKRLKEYGYNLVEEKKESNLIKFLKKFVSFSSIMLEIIIILYFIFGRYIDASLVLSLLFINVLISFIHEEKSK